MSGDQNFQQRWGLRGRDDVDSSSEESKSCSHDDQILKKHRLVPSSQLPENDEIRDSPLTRRDNEKLQHKGSSSGFGKMGKKRKENLAIKKQTKTDANKNAKKKKKKRRSEFKLISLDGLKVFTKSIIDELKVAREEMFARMNEEMGIISPQKSASRPKRKKDNLVEGVENEQCKNKVESAKKARKTNGAALKKSVQSDRAKGLSKSSDIIENHGSVSPKEKTKAKSSNIPLKEPICNPSDRLVSSPFLNLPTPVSEPRSQNLLAPTRKNGINLENTTLGHNEMSPQGYYPGTQMVDQLQNVSQMGFHNMGYFNQLRNRTSSTGFPVTLHQGLRNGFGFANQVMDNLSRENDIFGQRNDGMRFPGANHGFFGNYAGNNPNGKSD